MAEAAGVLGIGGVFFRSADPDTLSQWYRDMLGVGAGCAADDGEPSEWSWRTQGGDTVFAAFPQDSDYFPADRQYMLNFRVDRLDPLLERLAEGGVTAERRAEWDDPAIGRFARIHDPEGNPVELWEPPHPRG